jgi:hypothetical protein
MCVAALLQTMIPSLKSTRIPKEALPEFPVNVFKWRTQCIGSRARLVIATPLQLRNSVPTYVHHIIRNHRMEARYTRCGSATHASDRCPRALYMYVPMSEFIPRECVCENACAPEKQVKRRNVFTGTRLNWPRRTGLSSVVCMCQCCGTPNSRASESTYTVLV